MKRIQFLFALLVGKIIMGLTKIIPGVSGTTWPGGIANILMKKFPSYFKFGDNTRIVMVTGTSGKTTTTGMLSQLIKSWGKTICTNDIGANMDRGIATTLIRHSTMGGKVKADYVVLEVDERYLPIMTKLIAPHVILVTNVLKDQSQRNGEPGVIMTKLKAAIDGDMHLILNAHEPNSGSLGFGKKSVSYYGVAGDVTKTMDFHPMDVSCSCPVCGDSISFEYENLFNIGKYSCQGCGLKSEDDATIIAADTENVAFSCDGTSYKVKYISKDFMYCYASLMAFAQHEGIDARSIQKSIDDFKIQSGRVEQMKAGDKIINYLRIKQETPVTLQSAIDVATADKSEKIVVLDLSEIVDFSPKYTGMYYAYDCNFRKFMDGSVVKYICMSKTVCYDVATRLYLEGVDKKDITVIPTDDYDILLAELEKYDTKTVYLLTWMHSYYSCLNSIEKYHKKAGEQ